MENTVITELQEMIIDIVEAKFAQEGQASPVLKLETDLMSLLDSFSILDMILALEERSGYTADLEQMDIGEKMTVAGLAKEIVRINS